MTEDQQAQGEIQQETGPKEPEENKTIEERNQEPSTAEGAEEEPEVAQQTRALEQMEKEKEEYKSRFLRAQADYDNFRRRTKEEKTTEAKYRAQNLAEKLLPAFDNFERAMEIAPETSEAQSLLAGMEMVYRQLQEAFEAENIREIPAQGEPFDPHLHQAVMQVDHEDYESNTVVSVMQKGYTLNGRVIRPAMVQVAN